MDRNRFNAEVRPTSPKCRSASRASASIALNSTLGSTTISPATGVPHGKERPWDANSIPGLIMRAGIWHIDKRICGRRICQSTGTTRTPRSGTVPRKSDGRDPASPGLRRQAGSNLRAGRGEVCAGEPAQAEHRRRRQPLKGLMPWIGRRAARRCTWAALQPWIDERRAMGRPIGTINHGLQIVRRILNLAAGEWMDEHGLTWLHAPPKIKLLAERRKRAALSAELGRADAAASGAARPSRGDGVVCREHRMSRRGDLRPALGVGGRGARTRHIGLHRSRGAGEERRRASGCPQPDGQVGRRLAARSARDVRVHFEGKPMQRMLELGMETGARASWAAAWCGSTI